MPTCLLSLLGRPQPCITWEGAPQITYFRLILLKSDAFIYLTTPPRIHSHRRASQHLPSGRLTEKHMKMLTFQGLVSFQHAPAFAACWFHSKVTSAGVENIEAQANGSGTLTTSRVEFRVRGLILVGVFL